ncbi:MAG: hypothetical protein ACUVXA_13260, partial [Candidatus Jordarchaeum sp.]|uniref:hypothetical protein n=1 Tax=Candidatus Jordarchaeum sp. TaxID=2823881 RepID=UPI00404AE6F3
FEEAGVFPKGLNEIDRVRDAWFDITLKTLKKTFDVEVEEGEWTDAEKQYFKDFTTQFHSEPWIFARSAEKKYEEIPPGTSLGKAFVKVPAGPLIRAYILREGDKIKDMMFTGTMHMTPSDGLEKLEKELIGMKIDESAIKAKVSEWFGTGVQIGMLEPSKLVGVIMEACKLSYKR